MLLNQQPESLFITAYNARNQRSIIYHFGVRHMPYMGCCRKLDKKMLDTDCWILMLIERIQNHLRKSLGTATLSIHLLSHAPNQLKNEN